MEDLKWQDPPLDPRGWSVWGPTAAALRAHPGEWALIRENAKSISGLAGNIRAARVACFRPAGAFEATYRENPDGTYNTWARYVGENGEHK